MSTSNGDDNRRHEAVKQVFEALADPRIRKDALTGKNAELARAAAIRIQRLAQGDPTEPLWRLDALSRAFAAGGLEAVDAWVKAETTAGIQAGFLPPGAPSDPEWSVEGWFLRHRLNGLSAHGGLGKSRLAMQLALAQALGLVECVPSVEYEGSPIRMGQAEPIPTVYLSWEDSARAATRMAKGAASALEVDLDFDVLKGKLEFRDVMRAGPLWEAAGTGTGGLTEMARYVIEEVMPWAGLLVLDSRTSVFAADENARAGVRAFLNALDAAAIERACTVLLIAHSSDNKPVSGSTDWLNGIRSMAILEEVARNLAKRGEEKDMRYATRLSSYKLNEAAKPAPRWLTAKGLGGWAVCGREKAEE